MPNYDCTNMIKNNRNISIVILSLIIIGIFAIYYFSYGYLSALGQSVSDLSQKLEQESKQGQELKQSVTLLNQITPQIDVINSYFVSADGEVAFIDDIENRAKNLSLAPEINSVQIDKTKELSAKGLEYLTLNLAVKGKWSNVYKFVTLLPNLPYQIIVTQADIANQSEGTSSAAVWQGSFTLRVVKQSQ